MSLAQASLNSPCNGSPVVLDPVLGTASVAVMVMGSGGAIADKPGGGSSRPSASLVSLSASPAGDSPPCARNVVPARDLDGKGSSRPFVLQGVRPSDLGQNEIQRSRPGRRMFGRVILMANAISVNLEDDMTEKIAFNVSILSLHDMICKFRGFWPSLP
ncbi:hypothetical protein SUGI_0085400 [Cryptomeria japonica]|nr:hypothetical protein SUGI_0085400 [Cryptomeria japonica]